MNAQANTQEQPPAPMVKEKVVKEDGRSLYLYSFPPDGPAREKATEDADV